MNNLYEMPISHITYRRKDSPNYESIVSNRRLNILIIGLDLNPPLVEGIKNTVYETSQCLVDMGHQVSYLTKGRTGQLKREQVDRLVYHRIIVRQGGVGYTSGAFSFFYYLALVLRRIVSDENIDIIHTHSSYPMIGSYIAFLAKILRLGIPVVFTLYSSTNQAPPFGYTKTKMWLLKTLKSLYLLRYFPPNCIIATSSRTFRNLANWGSFSSLLIRIPNSVDTSRFSDSLSKKVDLIKEELELNSEAKIIFFGGDLTPYKGIELLIKAIYLINYNNDLKVQAIIPLRGGLYEKEKERFQFIVNLIKKLKIEGSFRFIGVRNDIENVYLASDLVVLPFLRSYSVMDLPRTLLEVMSIGKPVIASDVGGMSELIENEQTGLLVKPGDVHGLSRAMLRLLTDESLSVKICDNARQLIVKNYEVSKNVVEIEELYQRIVGSNQRMKR